MQSCHQEQFPVSGTVFTMNGRENDYTWSEAYVDNSQVVLVKKVLPFIPCRILQERFWLYRQIPLLWQP